MHHSMYFAKDRSGHMLHFFMYTVHMTLINVTFGRVVDVLESVNSLWSANDEWQSGFCH